MKNLKNWKSGKKIPVQKIQDNIKKIEENKKLIEANLGKILDIEKYLQRQKKVKKKDNCAKKNRSSQY